MELARHDRGVGRRQPDALRRDAVGLRRAAPWSPTWLGHPGGKRARHRPVRRRRVRVQGVDLAARGRSRPWRRGTSVGRSSSSLTRQQMFSQRRVPPGDDPAGRARRRPRRQADRDPPRRDVSQTSTVRRVGRAVRKADADALLLPERADDAPARPGERAPPDQMRAPGDATGTFALEVRDGRAGRTRLDIDPLELRLRNYAEKDEEENKPFTSKALRECYRQGAERFGWAKRNPKPARDARRRRMLVGWGMATATYPTNRSPSSASVRLLPDGRAVVTAAAHDLGTGTYTIMTQIAAETLGLPPEKVQGGAGRHDAAEAPVAGGSQTAASVGCGGAGGGEGGRREAGPPGRKRPAVAAERDQGGGRGRSSTAGCAWRTNPPVGEASLERLPPRGQPAGRRRRRTRPRRRTPRSSPSTPGARSSPRCGWTSGWARCG